MAKSNFKVYPINNTKNRKILSKQTSCQVIVKKVTNQNKKQKNQVQKQKRWHSK